MDNDPSSKKRSQDDKHNKFFDKVDDRIIASGLQYLAKNRVARKVFIHATMTLRNDEPIFNF